MPRPPPTALPWPRSMTTTPASRPSVRLSVLRRHLQPGLRQLRRQPDLHRRRLRLHRPLARPHDRRPAAHLAAIRRSRSFADLRRRARAGRRHSRGGELGRRAGMGVRRAVGPRKTFQVRLYPDGTNRILLLRRQRHQRRGRHRTRKSEGLHYPGGFSQRPFRATTPARSPSASAIRWPSTWSPPRRSSTRPTKTPTTTW